MKFLGPIKTQINPVVRLSDAEINHLRRLLGWIACEIGQSPEELVATVQKIAQSMPAPGEEGKARLVAAHKEAASVPIYVRQAVKALRKTLVKRAGDVADVDTREVLALESAAGAVPGDQPAPDGREAPPSSGGSTS